jgi:hypothetical protein
MTSEKFGPTEKSWDYTLIRYDSQGRPIYDTGWRPRILDIGDKKVEAYETNNLLLNITQAKSKREELRVNPTAPMLGRTHDYYFKQGAMRIFNAFEDNYPDLHSHLVDINQRLLEDAHSIELYTERDIYCSLAFEHLAAIALAFDPGFNTKKLTI